jgi:hypothetical protein
MLEKDYRLVFVGNTQVGLIGLKEIFEELKSQRKESESTLKEMLVEKAGKKNYIPPHTCAPALIINGKVKSKGTVPPKSMIKKWLEEEKNERKADCFEPKF